MSRRLLYLTALGIVMPLAACDNVQWGGAEVGVVPPPPRATAETEEELDAMEERVPRGPIVYHVLRRGSSATLVPVGEVVGASLQPVRAAADWELFGDRFIAEHLRQGAEFTLFHAGVRAGTLVVDGAEVPGPELCPPLPRGRGMVELSPRADEVEEFLAMAKVHASPLPRDAPSLEPDGRMRQLAPILAERVIRARRAPLPNNWQRAMAQLRPLPMGGDAGTGFATTFLVGDTLGPGLNDEGHSTFIIGEPRPQVGFDTAYVRFADYAAVGKSAPRVIDHLDWNGDGRPGTLLQVFGVEETWYEAVSHVQGRWQRVLELRCEPDAGRVAPAEPGGAEPLDDGRTPRQNGGR